MCIFNEPATVSNTKILVCPLKNQTQQLTVYSNRAFSEKPNAMILPIPSKKNGQDVKFIDFSSYPSFFKDLDKFFPKEYVSRNSSLESYSDSFSTNSLPVQRVGNYDCSIVPTLYDFYRIRKDIFQLSSTVANVLRNHYAFGFCFLICKFDPTVSFAEFHPIAYTHSCDGTIFIPTRHEHGKNNVQSTQNDADWDHDIYTINVSTREQTDSLRNDYRSSTISNAYSRWEVNKEGYCDLFEFIKKNQLKNNIEESLPSLIRSSLFLKTNISCPYENKDIIGFTFEKISESPACTSYLTNKDYILQPWYKCLTCGLIENLGCCKYCIEHCHKNHQIQYFGVTSSFCDCGVNFKCSPIPIEQQQREIQSTMINRDTPRTEPFLSEFQTNDPIWF